MSKKRIFFLALSFLCIAATVSGFGKKEKTAQEETSSVVQVTGIVRLVGSDLFPELVISGVDAQWFLTGETAAKLRDMQHKTVTVEGIETVKELKFANGLPAGIRRELRDIRIIDVELGGID